MKFRDYKQKLKYKNVVEARLYDLTNSEFKNNIILNTYSKISNCSNVTYKSKCKNCGNEYFLGSNSCNNRFCPICAKKRSLKYLATLLPAFEEYLKLGHSVHLVTLTMENTYNFMEGLEKIYSAFRYMTHQNKYYARIFKYMFVGGVKSLEIIKGVSNNETYHSHLHLLVIKKRFTRDYEFLKQMWNNSLNFVYGTTNMKIGSVHLKQVKNPNNKSNKQSMIDIRTGLLETVKYITKIEDIFEYEDKMLSDFITYSHNKRYISVFGLFAKYAKALNEEINESEKDQVGKICKVCGCSEFEFRQEYTSLIGSLDDFN